jgi:hypothetical protein
MPLVCFRAGWECASVCFVSNVVSLELLRDPVRPGLLYDGFIVSKASATVRPEPSA